ncbi:zinc finger domain-containing protein [Nocardioides soli]|uniref:zinc finger domain-containing protein n=1 Tax=Nocardioides soli TaxID=1036020 RepID=UPI003CCE411C
MQASAPGLTPADVAKMIACPTCRARVDQMCRTTTGRTRSPHPTRLVIKRCPCGEPINPGRKVCDDCRAEARRINGRNGMRATRARRQAIRQAAA